MNTDNYFHKIISGSPVLSDQVKNVILQNESGLDDSMKLDIMKTILGYESAVAQGIRDFEDHKNVSADSQS